MSLLALTHADVALIGAVFFLVVASFMLAGPALLVLHELGHLGLAAALGYRLHELRFGHGKLRWKITAGDLLVKVRESFAGGGVVATPRRASRWREAIFIAAGIGAELVLFVTFAVGAFGLAAQDANRFGIGLMSAATGVLAATAHSIWLSVIPRRRAGGNEEHPNDGMRLVELFRDGPSQPLSPSGEAEVAARRLMAGGDLPGALAIYEAELSQSPEDPHAAAMAVHLLGRVKGPHAVVQWYLDRALTPTDGEDSAWAWTWGNVAWQALRTGDPTLLTMAQELSAAALAALPDRPALKATEGAIRMASGSEAEGRLMMLGAIRELDDPAEKAEFAAFLATQDSPPTHPRAQAYRELERHLLAIADG